jgi:hypothetical protein
MKKNNLIYLLPLLLLAAGCHKPSNNPDSTSLYPLGTFTGQFMRIHKKPAMGYDTTKANLQLVLSTVTGYAITGDTSVHAPSYGSFSETATYMLFNDVTYTAMGKQKKTHLAGEYIYAFDGLKLKISAPNGDSLVYKYELTKIKN